jgi:hypothetical protein
MNEYLFILFVVNVMTLPRYLRICSVESNVGRRIKIGEDVEEGGRGLMLRTVPAFACRKPGKPSVLTAGLRVEI